MIYWRMLININTYRYIRGIGTIKHTPMSVKDEALFDILQCIREKILILLFNSH